MVVLVLEAEAEAEVLGLSLLDQLLLPVAVAVAELGFTGKVQTVVVAHMLAAQQV
jgi:hypothetical protein